MKRLLVPVLALLCLVPRPVRADDPAPAPAPLYSLPADGTWVEYDWQGLGADGAKQSGTLRISSVGAVDVKGQLHRWVECQLVTRVGDKLVTKVRKLLIAEKGFEKGGSLRDAVAAVYALDDGQRELR